jgi:hypothetical protein
MKIIQKKIVAGSKEYEKKDGTKVKTSWPEGTIKFYSATNEKNLTPCQASAIDAQFMQHDLSSAYRSGGGKMSFPAEKTDGKKFYVKDGVVYTNWDYIPSERTSNEEKVAELVKFAKHIETISAGAMTAKDYVLQSMADKKTKEAALAELA